MSMAPSQYNFVQDLRGKTWMITAESDGQVFKERPNYLCGVANDMEQLMAYKKVHVVYNVAASLLLRKNA